MRTSNRKTVVCWRVRESGSRVAADHWQRRAGTIQEGGGVAEGPQRAFVVRRLRIAIGHFDRDLHTIGQVFDFFVDRTINSVLFGNGNDNCVVYGVVTAEYRRL